MSETDKDNLTINAESNSNYIKINEILAKIKSGHTDYYKDLWTHVEAFVRMKAEKYARNINRYDITDDMIQEAYLSLYEAVDYYNPDSNKSFIGTLAEWYLPKSFHRACYGTITNEPLNDYTSLYSPVKAADDSQIQLIDTIIDSKSEAYYDAIENQDFWESVGEYLRNGINAMSNEEDRKLLLFMLDNNSGYGKAFEEKILGEKSRTRYAQIFDRARRNMLRWMRSKGKIDRIKTGIDDYLYSSRLYAGSLGSFRNNGYSSNVERLALDLIEKEYELKIAETVCNISK